MLQFNKSLKLSLLTSSMMIVSVVPCIAMAAATLEEMVVTAQKREESLQDVPVTITAFGQSQLQEAGFDSISDLTQMSPSLQFGNFGPVTFVTMRGIGNENTTAGGDPGVAMHLDGVYMGRPVASLFSAFDTERVEILRGPQGTLYGRNATGGSINLITAKPGDEFGGEVDITYGDYDWLRVRGAINLPVSDVIKLRLVAFSEDRDGYTENSFPGGNEANDADDAGVRGHISIELADQASLLLSGSYITSGGVGTKAELREPFPGSTTGQNISGPPAFAFDPLGPASGIPALNNFINPQTGQVVVNDLTPFQVSKDTKESQDNEFTMFSATFEWDFDDLSFKSITGYAQTSYESRSDDDQSELNLLELLLIEDSEQFSQELQLLSADDGPLQWIVGFYYFSEKASREALFLGGRYDVFANQFGVRAGYEFGGDVDSTSFAGFAQATYELTENLRLTGGLRYTEDEKEGVNTGFLFAGEPYADPLEDSWDEVTYRLAVDWNLNDDLMLFSSYATGYKSGGINQTAAVSRGAENAIYQPETVDAYEAGIKATLLNGRMQLNSSLYRNEYDNLQFQVFGQSGPEAFNAQGAVVQGAEAELRAVLIDSLTVDASVGITDSEFDDQIINGVQIGGNQVQRTPDLTYSLGISNDWEVGEKGSLKLRLEYAFTDEIYYTALNRNAGFAEAGGSDLADDYDNVNIRLFWFSSDDRWTVETFVTNLTDEEQEGNILRGPGFVDIAGGGGPELVTYNPPRQWGMRLGYQF
ncbi:TonB-dependent receptor [Agarilytica rhodophyticola]|uniref:TonB-dependent receptor n=1 Tax=Agarilytica rhodophyticola TaxID=1737490 RepID=UPI000B34513D|nr:TonB-dependent receptor [Agarilytica rhodophyticola]